MNTKEQPIVHLEKVSFQYEPKRKVLDQVTLSVRPGDFLALLGPNGSGKSTLIKLILGLLKPQEGQITLFGQPQKNFKEWFKIGYVSQKANSFNSGFPATVYEVVASGLFGKIGLFGRVGKHKQEIMDAIHQVGLDDYVHQPIGRLSGGQQQRVFIARALVSRPQLLILDEPFVGVDAESAKRFMDLLVKLNAEQNISLLLVSHDIGAITDNVKQVACLNRRLFYHGAPQDFMTNREKILSQVYGYNVQVLEHLH